jgi:hypothetical protein
VSKRICGHSWEAIQRAQRGGRLHEPVKINTGKDYGADPVGDGTFRMMPSGDVVDWVERCRRLDESASALSSHQEKTP